MLSRDISSPFSVEVCPTQHRRFRKRQVGSQRMAGHEAHSGLNWWRFRERNRRSRNEWKDCTPSKTQICQHLSEGLCRPNLQWFDDNYVVDNITNAHHTFHRKELSSFDDNYVVENITNVHHLLMVWRGDGSSQRLDWSRYKLVGQAVAGGRATRMGTSKAEQAEQSRLDNGRKVEDSLRCDTRVIHIRLLTITLRIYFRYSVSDLDLSSALCWSYDKRPT